MLMTVKYHKYKCRKRKRNVTESFMTDIKVFAILIKGICERKRKIEKKENDHTKIVIYFLDNQSFFLFSDFCLKNYKI